MFIYSMCFGGEVWLAQVLELFPKMDVPLYHYGFASALGYALSMFSETLRDRKVSVGCEPSSSPTFASHLCSPVCALRFGGLAARLFADWPHYPHHRVRHADGRPLCGLCHPRRHDDELPAGLLAALCGQANSTPWWLGFNLTLALMAAALPGFSQAQWHMHPFFDDTACNVATDTR
jgi:hypothetical protein